MRVQAKTLMSEKQQDNKSSVAANGPLAQARVHPYSFPIVSLWQGARIDSTCSCSEWYQTPRARAYKLASTTSNANSSCKSCFALGLTNASATEALQCIK